MFAAKKTFGYDFFISYARKDAHAYARELHRLLEGHGFTVFLDRRDIYAGEGLTDAIRRGIRRSRRVLWVDSPGARDSPYVSQELDEARKHAKYVIRIWSDPVSPKEPVGGDSRVFVPESFERVYGGAPSQDTLDAVVGHGAAMRSRTWLLLVVATLGIAGGWLGQRTGREALGRYFVVQAEQRRTDDAASIAAMDATASVAAAVGGDGPAITDAAHRARRVVLKRRAWIPTAKGERPWITFSAIVNSDPLELIAVANGELVRIAPPLSETPTDLFATLFAPAMAARSPAPAPPVVLAANIAQLPAAAGTPSGSHVAYFSSGRLHVFDGDQSIPCAAAIPAADPPAALAIGDDGHTVAARSAMGADTTSAVLTGRLWIWDTGSCGSTRSLTLTAAANGLRDCQSNGAQWPQQMAVSTRGADGAFLALPTGPQLVVVHAATGEEVRVSYPDGHVSFCAAHFADDRTLVAATSDEVFVFSREAGSRTWAPPPGPGAHPRVQSFASYGASGFVTVAPGELPPVKLWRRTTQGYASEPVGAERLFTSQVVPVTGDRLATSTSLLGMTLMRKPGAAWQPAGDIVDPRASDEALWLRATGRWLLKQTRLAAVVFEVRQ